MGAPTQFLLPCFRASKRQQKALKVVAERVALLREGGREAAGEARFPGVVSAPGVMRAERENGPFYVCMNVCVRVKESKQTRAHVRLIRWQLVLVLLSPSGTVEPAKAFELLFFWPPWKKVVQ